MGNAEKQIRQVSEEGPLYVTMKFVRNWDKSVFKRRLENTVYNGEIAYKTKLNSVALVRKRTIPTERLPLSAK
jgi:hypothetical protein